jgi:carbonic anhydrase/acetyltransferase-like protein (isoleucine patch superfamily)
MVHYSLSNRSAASLASMTLEERLNTFLGKDPTIDPTAFIAPGATVVGDVRMGPQSSIWPGAVARGDINFIEISEGSNIQDGTIVHLADDFPVVIGKHVTIGHAAIVHACVIENECLIGMGATILDGAVIGHHSIIGANSLVTQNTIIPPGSMALGTPAKVVKTLTEDQQAGIRKWAEKYVLVSNAHRRKRS